MYFASLNGHLRAKFIKTLCIVPLERAQRTMTDLEKKRVNSEDGLFFSGAWDRFAQLLRGHYNYYDAYNTTENSVSSFSLSLSLSHSHYSFVRLIIIRARRLILRSRLDGR